MTNMCCHNGKKLLLTAALLLIGAIVLGGCTGRVVRTMTIESDPPGALVSVNDNQVGRTPLTTQFTHYGTYRIRLQQSGYQTLTVYEPVRAPWYQWPLIDLAFETVVPGTRRDEHHLGPYQLQPAVPSDPQALLQRAEAMRHEAALPVEPE